VTKCIYEGKPNLTKCETCTIEYCDTRFDLDMEAMELREELQSMYDDNRIKSASETYQQKKSKYQSVTGFEFQPI